MEKASQAINDLKERASKAENENCQFRGEISTLREELREERKKCRDLEETIASYTTPHQVLDETSEDMVHWHGEDKS